MNYTITIAKSKRGKYHISRYDEPFVPHEPQISTRLRTWTNFRPLCKTPPRQRYTPWSNPNETGIIAVWRTFVNKLSTQLTCDKCETASWNLMKLEMLAESDDTDS
jgi:hypothetical protein